MPLVEEAALAPPATLPAPALRSQEETTETLMETLMQKHLAVSPSHSAVNVDVVTSPRGLKFWLVPLPRGAARFARIRHARRRGAGPGGKGGPGRADGGGFSTRARANSIRRRFTALSTRKRSKCRSIATAIIGAGACARSPRTSIAPPSCLRLAVNAPRFDEEPFERVREHMNARLRHDANDPATLANRNWKAKSFPASPLRPAGRRDARNARAHRAGRSRQGRQARDRARPTADRGRRRDRRKGRGGAGRQGVRRPAGQGRSQAHPRGCVRGPRRDRPDRSRRAAIDDPLRPAGAQARRPGLHPQPSSPPMCWAARAR